VGMVLSLLIRGSLPHGCRDCRLAYYSILAGDRRDGIARRSGSTDTPQPRSRRMRVATKAAAAPP